MDYKTTYQLLMLRRILWAADLIELWQRQSSYWCQRDSLSMSLEITHYLWKFRKIRNISFLVEISMKCKSRISNDLYLN